MTAPLASGFPDFGRFASEAQVLEINDLGVSRAHNFGYPFKYVGNAQALQLWANSPGQAMRIQLQFYGDNQGQSLMDSYVVNLQAGDVVKQTIPILGPWVLVFIQYADSGTHVITLQLWRTPGPGQFAGLEGDIAVFGVSGVAIGGSAGATLLSQYVMEGVATWSFFMTGGNFQVTLFARDFQGNKTPIDRVDNATPSRERRTVYLPPWSIQVDIGNNNAAAQTYDIYMTRRHNR